MSETLTNLALVEKQLPELTFTQEQSNLSQLNEDFAPFLGKNFCQWLEKFSEDKDRFQVLEIGGGVDQVAARQLLKEFGNLYLTEVEKREVRAEVRRNFEASGRCQLYQNGFSEVVDDLPGGYDIIFLHNVLNHLPNPFFILQRCYSLLADEGILFVNEILIYEEEWEKIEHYLKEGDYKFSYQKAPVSSAYQKKGIASLSLTILKDEEHNDFSLPLREGEYLSDFEGRKLPVKEIFYDGSD